MGNTERLEKLLIEYPADARVHQTLVPKSNGTSRPIITPNKPLNKWLKLVKRELRQLRKDWPTFIHGGVKKRSYVSFVRPHTNKKTVITIDIHECFSSITQDKVQTALISKLSLDAELAQRLSKKLCYKGHLPQGFATSSYLANLCLNDTLLIIKRKANRLGASVTVYVDDIALSGQRVNPGELINVITTELSRANLLVKKAKIKVMQSHQPQIICGLTVNRGVMLTRQKRKELFASIANGSMSEISLRGWLANLNMLDKKLMQKLEAYAIKKGVISN